MVVGLAVIGGLVLLALAPDRFVAGSAGLADRWGVSRIVIGAIVIGFGTSSPEMLVSGIAAARGEPEVGVGNVIGSNMANLGLIVGIAALVGHVAVPHGLLRRELPLMLVATGAFAFAVQDGLTRVEGFALLAGLVVALLAIVGGSLRAGREEAELDSEIEEFLAEEETQPAWRLVVTTVVGLLGTLAGAQLLVSGAVEIAEALDVSGGLVGLTIVALGTSLPELVTAVAAARVGEDQLILGNVLGSNLFNCLAVGAVVGLVDPSRLADASLTVGAVGLMLAITVLATFVLGRRQHVSRGEAITLVASYLACMPLLAV